MNYKKLVISISPFEGWLRDILNAQLAEIGFESFVDSEKGMEAYISENNFDLKKINAVFSGFEKKFKITFTLETIADQNWNEVWEKNYFKPLLIKNCIIRAPFHHDYPEAEYEIIIEPNMAFGTGNHETTSLMIEMILNMNIQGKQVLDMGCGTGILGILTSMKGAQHITAIDIDEWSVDGTHINAALNKITNITVKSGDASLLKSEIYDIILANIHKNVLINDMEKYSQALKTEGEIILSGFYTKDIPEIKAKARSSGLQDDGFLTKNNWVAYRFKKTIK